MSNSLDDIVTELSQLTGSSIGDMGDEHERWSVYQSALKQSECIHLLFSAVALEPVPSLALSTVLQVLGKLPQSDRPVWIEQLQLAENRDYATRRAREFGIYQSRDVTPLLIDEDVQDSWSDWLQLLLAEFSKEPAVLGRLLERGRTKRIRRFAAERLAIVGRELS